ncbi:MAG: DUF4173 domain-containing protein [Nocardioidaceae bacterium]|nr:DUF4173 domain-containing protein [Nocardioidaceae bacterium]
MSGPRPPLAFAASLKVKLGVLVAASVAVAAVIGTVGAAGGVAPWLAIPVTIALALAVTQLLAVGMTAPLREMTDAARRMARGDYDVRVSAPSRDEVGLLADAFNTMARDLATVDRERRDLVATVSHELRTPLTAVSLRLENLADGIEPNTPDAFADLLRQVRALGTLVTDLLDLSRVHSGAKALDLGDVALGQLLAQAAADLTLPTRPVSFEVRVVPEDLTVRADPARLRQLVVNVLDNAGRHSPADGVVTVDAAATPGGGWRLEVADQGPGIPAEQRERVFERFGTLAGHEGGGTGLGLAIARWVAELHGGTIRFDPPPAGRAGALLRVELPSATAIPSAATVAAPTRLEEPMPATTPSPTPTPATAPSAAPPPLAPPSAGFDAVFGPFWPERDGRPRVDILVAAALTGVLAGIVIPDRSLGSGTLVVLAAAGLTVLYAARHRFDPFTLASAALCAVLAAMVVVRDATWIVTLDLLAGAGLLTIAVNRGRTVLGFVLSGLAWPLAGLRGLPWLGRTAAVVTRGGRTSAVLRTVVWSLAGVLVFSLLFASADVLFQHWVDVILPDWTVDTLVARVFMSVFVGGVVLAAAYLALNPPAIDEIPRRSRPVRERFEWVTPVLLVNAVFVVFLVAQLAELSGGDDYVQRTTGLTYSHYAHRGFWQLVVATMLTLLVVWAAARKASVETATDRLWMRAVLGPLLVMTLAVVASALHRMNVYDDAYGFTRLRLLVSVFEGWLGVVVVAVVVAGLGLRAAWLARFALLTGAAALAGLGLINPDGWIAGHNIDRYVATGKIDSAYLSSLSADAVPAVMRLPEGERGCAMPARWLTREQDWLSWNLGRARAEHALGGRELPEAGDACVARMIAQDD